jgi:hypothetical protein
MASRRLSHRSATTGSLPARMPIAGHFLPRETAKAVVPEVRELG